MLLVMTALRLISFPVHGAVEMLLGFALMAVPVALGLSPAAAVSGVVVGTILVGLSLSSTDAGHDPRGTMTLSAHHAFDYGLATGLLGAAAILGATGDKIAALVFGLAAAAQLALNLTTRYSHR